eukprot:TRINITY_DN10740_c0_g1_i22.p1 TRINITY_DN10740_c0_g1~~TRINITY_DN10740_c0_g1_i22.p1  ORF type:complete len:200 (+),score=9.59 TRINITY_DN10740_c0_g1_i22:185-784(+)
MVFPQKHTFILLFLLVQLTAAESSSRLLSPRDARSLPELFAVKEFWQRTRGVNVKVAVLDTGIDTMAVPTTFKNVATMQDFTDENTIEDKLGHGTFIAGIIAGSNSHCPGLSPQSQLHIFKIFNKHGGSFAQHNNRNQDFVDNLGSGPRHGAEGGPRQPVERRTVPQRHAAAGQGARTGGGGNCGGGRCRQRRAGIWND